VQVKSEFFPDLSLQRASTIIKPLKLTAVQVPKQLHLPRKRPNKIEGLNDLKELKLITDATPTRSASTIKSYTKKSDSLSKIKQVTTIFPVLPETRDEIK